MTFNEIQAMLDNAGADCDGSKVEGLSENKLRAEWDKHLILCTPLGYYKPGHEVFKYYDFDMGGRKNKNILATIVKNNPEDFYYVKSIPSDKLINPDYDTKSTHKAFLPPPTKLDHIAIKAFVIKHFKPTMLQSDLGTLLNEEFAFTNGYALASKYVKEMGKKFKKHPRFNGNQAIKDSKKSKKKEKVDYVGFFIKHYKPTMTRGEMGLLITEELNFKCGAQKAGLLSKQLSLEFVKKYIKSTT